MSEHVEHPAIPHAEAMAAVRNLAEMTWAYYTDLVEHGFDPESAIALTGKWLIAVSGGHQ